MYGSLEVILFPRDYERNMEKLNVDARVFVKGRAQVEDLKDGKLIGFGRGGIAGYGSSSH